VNGARHKVEGNRKEEGGQLKLGKRKEERGKSLRLLEV
jgi:hypothetical protein